MNSIADQKTQTYALEVHVDIHFIQSLTLNLFSWIMSLVNSKISCQEYTYSLWTLKRRTPYKITHFLNSNILLKAKTDSENIGVKIREKKFFPRKMWASELFYPKSRIPVPVLFQENQENSRVMLPGKIATQRDLDIVICQFESELISKIKGCLLSWKQWYLQ